VDWAIADKANTKAIGANKPMNSMFLTSIHGALKIKQSIWQF